MVHLFSRLGYNIAVDTASASVHVLDDVAFDVVSRYGKEPEDEIVSSVAGSRGVGEDEVRECLADVKELVAAGTLFSEDKFRPDVNALAKRASVVKALCLHVAHTCNLDCEYCFASQGKYHGERALMTFDVAKRAIDFLIDNSGGRHNLEVDFFGGEPLMNWNVVKKTVEYARSREKECGKHFRFTLTTNGILVDDEVIEFSNREMDNVVMSLDGRREVNDRFRKTVGGTGSFDVIVPKFQKFAAARGDKDYYIRGTFTHLNPDFMKDIEVMLALGFDKLSMEPVVASPDSPYALTEEDKAVVMEQYELLAKKMIEKKRAGYTFRVLSLYVGSGTRSVYLQAYFRVRLRHGVSCRDADGRALSLSSVRGGEGVRDGQRIRRHFRGGEGGGRAVQTLQRLLQAGMRRLLGKAVLFGRLRCQRMARRRRRQRRLLLRLRPLPLPHGMRPRRQSRRSATRMTARSFVLRRCRLFSMLDVN